jgi:hypothetical protein
MAGGGASARDDMARTKNMAGHTKRAIRFICAQPTTQLALL